MPLEGIMEEVRALSVAERKRLISAIIDTLSEPAETLPKKRSILEFEGVGAEMWQGIDAQEYVNKLRGEWDEPT